MKPADLILEKDVLEAVLKRSIDTFTASRYPYSATHPLMHIEIRFTDGEQTTVMVKYSDCSAEATPDGKPDFLYDPWREPEIYEELRKRSHHLSQHYLGSYHDADRDCLLLFFKFVRGRPLYEVGDFAVWLDAAAHLSNVHADLIELRSTLKRPITVDHDLLMCWPQRALAGSGGEDRLFLSEVLEAYEDVVSRLLSSQIGVLHGEYYPANILVVDETSHTLPLDWEMAAVGPLLLDLAALMSGKWSERERVALAEAYFSQGVHEDAWESFLEDLELCRLHCALQWLGWSQTWTPPDQFRHDWLADVRNIWAKLGVSPRS